MEELPNISKLIKPIIDEKGQTKIDFRASEKLLEILKKLNEKYPLIRNIIKDRISYDGIYFFINKVKMTEEELELKMQQLNKYETKKIKIEELFEQLFGETKLSSDKNLSKLNSQVESNDVVDTNDSDNPGWDLYGRFNRAKKTDN